MHSRSSVTTRVCAFAFAVLVIASPIASFAQMEKVDLDAISQIRDEGFRHSKVMDILSELTDHIGPRLTGSPNMKRANEWTRDQLAQWGLQNAHLEAWGPFGRGWEQEYVSVRMTTPDITPLYAYPKAWTPGTAGAVSGKAVWVNIQTKEDMEKYKGQLAGKIVFSGPLREVLPQEKAALTRYDEKSLEDVYDFQAQERRGGPNFDAAQFRQRQQLQREVQKFLADEKPLAVIEGSRGDGGTMFVQSGGPYQADQPQATVPQLVMTVEHWGRVVRLLQKKYDVALELDVRTKFFDNVKDQWDTIAEIPGTDPKLKDEVVMLGAHLDSWHSGTGATDNGAGSAASMEAVRILKTLADRGAIKPRRTIRIALWSGEEQGLLGSRAYVKNHFGSREELPGQADVPSFMRRQGPLKTTPENAKIAAYFNIDNGTGRIRGIYCQENAAVRPIFEQWFTPFHDLGAQTVSMRNTGGTDHLSFDSVGIPGFQFIQDPVEYDTRTHHSNMDVYERVQANDMMQMSVIEAAFIYMAAQREDKLPRKPVSNDDGARGRQQASSPTATILPANPPAKTAVGQ
jgi:carboxypeptidase Q